MRAFIANPKSPTAITEITEELLQFTPSQAQAQLHQFAVVATACPTFPVEIPVGTISVPATISLTQETFSGYGDQDAAILLTASVGTTDIAQADIVAVRHGGTVILVVNAAAQLNNYWTFYVVGQAYDKVAARW